MHQEDTAAKTASRELTNTSMKPRPRRGMRPSQHPRQGLGIKAPAAKGGNLTPAEHFAMSGAAFRRQRREGEAGTSREETVPDWSKVKYL